MSEIKINGIELTNVKVEELNEFDFLIIQVRGKTTLKNIKKIFSNESGTPIDVYINNKKHTLSLGRRLFDKTGEFKFSLTTMDGFNSLDLDTPSPVYDSDTALRNAIDISEKQNKVIHEIVKLLPNSVEISPIINDYLNTYPKDYSFSHEVIDLKKLENDNPYLA